MQLYSQFIDFCNSLMKYITTQNLVYGALISLAFFLVWTAFAVVTSSIRRFYIRCDKLEWYISNHQVGYDNMNSIDRHCRKISRSFFHCWNKFKRSNGKKPSDFLTKRDAFDTEVSNGMLNHGKTLMRTYVGVTTVLLFILNLAQIGKDAVFTFNVFVEAMFLPFIYYVVMMLIYFIANLIKQQIYIIATAHFYSLVDRLDKCFDTNDYFAETKQVLVSNATKPEIEEKIEEPNLQEGTKQVEQQEHDADTQEEVAKQFEEQEPASVENEMPEVESELETEDQDNGDFSELENEESEVVETVEEPETEPEINPVSRNWEAEENLDYYDVFKKKNINVDKYINEIPNEEEYSTPFINVDREFVPSDEMTADDQESNDERWETTVSKTEDELDETKDDSFAEFEIANEQEESEETVEEESKDELAKEEPHESQEIEQPEEESEDLVSYDTEEVETIENEQVAEIEDGLEDELNNQDNQSENIIEENEDENDDFDFFNISGSDESEPDVDFFAEGDSTYNEEDKQNDFRSQIEKNLNESTKEIDSKLEDNQADAAIDLSALVGEFKQVYHNDDEETLIEEAKEVSETDNNFAENADNNGVSSTDAKEIYAKINDLEELIHSAIDKSSEDKNEKSTKTKKSRKGKTKMTRENEGEKKTRGRPKMQIIDENLVITSEEQFEEILSRAEKLMRKSEQGLSASQSKRIEKELKIMMDAMNKYKEG